MIIGNPSRFAIEFELKPQYGGVWMWGHLRYWCVGTELGDFRIDTSLRDALFELDGMRWAVGKHESERFQKMPALEMIRQLHAGLFPFLYGEHGLVPPGLPEEEQWARHKIAPCVDVFDGWRVFLVESDHTGRIVYARRPFTEASSVEVSRGEVDEVLMRARQEMDAVYERERALELAGGVLKSI